MPEEQQERLMRWNGSEWVEVSLVRKEVESGNSSGMLEIKFINDMFLPKCIFNIEILDFKEISFSEIPIG